LQSAERQLVSFHPPYRQLDLAVQPSFRARVSDLDGF
jgi:hypothetical protein